MKRKRGISVRLGVIAATFLILGIIPCFLTEKVNAQHMENVFPVEAMDLSRDCVFHVSENAENQGKSVDTSWSASGDAFIEIDAPQIIGSIYIEWTSLPGEWTLSVWDKGVYVLYKKNGSNGFLNEYVSVEKSYTKIRISWDKKAKPVSIGRITIFSRGVHSL